MKKRNKKYNPLAAQQIMAERTLKKANLLFCAGYSNCYLYHDTGIRMPVDREVQRVLKWYRFKWNVTLFGFMRDHTGREYIVDKVINFDTPANQKEIADAITKQHMHLIKKDCNPLHLVNVGYVYRINTDTETDVSGAVQEVLFDKFDTFKHPAKWEVLAKFKEHGIRMEDDGDLWLYSWDELNKLCEEEGNVSNAGSL